MTIIVLLILAGISIQMLTGDNGILTRAGEARDRSDRAQITEQARLDILAEIADKKGENPTDTKIKEILGTYFTSDTIPDDLSDLNQEMTTKNGGYTVKLSEVLNGVTVKQEEKEETPIPKSTAITDSYVGYYADIDNDGDVDGIIYADMVVGNTKSGKWNNDSWSNYNVTKIDDKINAKDYVISSKTYGQAIPGKYKANDGFGENDVLVPATNSTGTKDRFYVMALEDFMNNSKNTFYWYYNANLKLDRDIPGSTDDFGYGKQKTIDMINDWNNNTAQYGAQTTVSSGKDYFDLWGAIQDGQYSIVGLATDSRKWFIPSKAEWSAFAEELEITTDNYESKELSDRYWSCSQSTSGRAYGAYFNFGLMSTDFINWGEDGHVRLSTTF